jgi:hypothetical protein
MRTFPGGRRFAFSILDDTDDATLENVQPMYELLRERGLRTTKTVWPLDCPEGSCHFFAADTLQRKPYLDFVHELVEAGFELAFHGATMESSPRERTLEGLEFIRAEFGHYPRVFCNHGHNRENLYWGPHRYRSRPFRVASRLLARRSTDRFEGEHEASAFFWGDVCRETIDYVRNFTFERVNVLAVDPAMPYRLASTPYVNHWFSTADAPDVAAFNRLLAREDIDRLEAAGGVCLVSTHFGKGFVRDGVVDAEAKAILEYVADRDGWFVPVSEILDWLRANGDGGRHLGPVETMRLEGRFVADRIRNRRGHGR